MVLLRFDGSLSEEKSGGRRRRRRRPRRKSGGGGNAPKETVEDKSSDSVERALARFKANPPPIGFPSEIDPPPKTIEVNWALNAVPRDVQKKAGEIIMRRGEFGFLPQERVDEIADQISGLPITLEQALSLRNALNQEKSVYSHHKLMRRSNELNRRYDSGEDVISLSKRFDAPPVNTFRAILTGRGWSKNRIKETLKEPSRLKKRDREQFELAESLDRVSSVNQEETHKASMVFEDVLYAYFDSIGVRYRTQDDLMIEQKKAEGRAVITPDLLMIDDVRINGVPCAWIDAKHFFGADLKFPRKKTQKQVDRYVAEYGHGAIVYRHGFCDGLRIEGAEQLDASPLDLTLLDEFHENSKNS
jgi:hypothetical protein